ncbi:hypothetical protein RB195_003097 [Necator americanus]|uniref:LIM domain protein n=1 Tax=Necator americanus TaxID=51031 RepID=A0ABR1DPU8_NECAM
METVTVRMARSDRGTSWGFGVTEAPNRDVVIVNVVGGSLADRAGLRNGDILDQLEGLGNLDINAVDRLLVTSRDKIELVVHRIPGAQTRIWRPEVSDQRGYGTSVEDRPYRVSLEHSNDSRPPQGFNAAALPFNTDPRVKHLQYNSPMGIYSNESAAEQYVQQTQGIIDNGVPNIPRQSNEPAYLRSETLRYLKEEENRPKGSLSEHPNPNGLPVCYICSRPILGVMCRAAGHDLHGDCLSCATCGSSLRNIGHHFIEDKFYCEVHGRQKKGLGPAMDPNLAAKTSPTSAQPIRPADGGRSFYQPEVLARRPLSVSPTPQHTAHIHYGTPKTQGTLSPSLRGVPSAVNYEGSHHSSIITSGTVTARPIHVQSQISPNPPPIPSNPPPESRVPASVRSAVSPRRSFRQSKQWPPPKGLPTLRYWQIDPASQSRKEKEHEPTSLHDMVEATDREKSPRPQRKARKKDRPNGTEATQAQIVYAKIFQGHETVATNVKNDRVELEEEISTNISLDAVEENSGEIQYNTATAATVSAEASIHCLAIEKCSLPEQSVHPSEIPELHLSEPEWDSTSIQADVLLEHFEGTTLLHVPETTDSSTSPIPTIELPRRRAGATQHSGIVRALSPTPFKAPPVREITPEPVEQSIQKVQPQPVTLTPHPSEHLSLLVGINTTPRPFVPQHSASEPTKKFTKTKPLKKVDFTKATIIPESWKNTTEVVDESDITTEPPISSSSPLNSPPVEGEGDESASNNVNAPYDGDVSEDNKSENGSIVGSDVAEERERWMREELELARKEELVGMGGPPLQPKKADHHHEKEEWRQQAMALLTDDSQAERDYAIVAALNERLQGLRDMEEADRQKAIECIERHQRNLEEQQDQLSVLLDSAIAYLKNLDTSRTAREEQSLPEPSNEAMTPQKEETTSNEIKVDSLSDVLEELEAIPARYRGPADFITEHLTHIDHEGQSFSRSTFEQRTDRRMMSGGGSPVADVPAKQVQVEMMRGHGSINSLGSRIPYCESCKQQIKGAYVLAAGLAWCPEHFVCAYRGCGRRLLECGFVEENGLKYCENCFEANIAPRCAKCSKPIISDCLNAMQKKWHPTCFTCAHCHKPFGNTAFYLENGLAYCEQDWNQLFTTKCVACKYPIEAGDRWVEALGNAFHSNCFNCTRCHSNLEGESFFAKNGQPYCKMHA